MRRGQRYFLVELVGGQSQGWQKGLLIELEKIIGFAGLGSTEASFVREGKGNSGGRIGQAKLPDNRGIIRTSVSGDPLFRGALALVTSVSGVPARAKIIRKSGTLKGLLYGK